MARAAHPASTFPALVGVMPRTVARTIELLVRLYLPREPVIFGAMGSTWVSHNARDAGPC